MIKRQDKTVLQGTMTVMSEIKKMIREYYIREQERKNNFIRQDQRVSHQEPSSYNGINRQDERVLNKEASGDDVIKECDQEAR